MFIGMNTEWKNEYCQAHVYQPTAYYSIIRAGFRFSFEVRDVLLRQGNRRSDKNLPSSNIVEYSVGTCTAEVNRMMVINIE